MFMYVRRYRGGIGLGRAHQLIRIERVLSMRKIQGARWSEPELGSQSRATQKISIERTKAIGSI